MLQNHPTFIILWFAILKIGAVAAFINNNLSEGSLLHCVKVADAKLLIFDPKYEQQVATIVSETSYLEKFAYGEATEQDELSSLPFAPSLTPSVLQQYSDDDPSDDLIKNTSDTDKAMLIYTR